MEWKIGDRVVVAMNGTSTRAGKVVLIREDQKVVVELDHRTRRWRVVRGATLLEREI